MTHSINVDQLASTDDQIPLLPQFKKIEEKGKKVDHLIEINEKYGQDLSGSQTNKSVNQIFDEMFENLNNSSITSHTIFKVNVGLRKSNPDAYTPKMVSIGPYHRKNPQLHPMEKYKLLYLQRFLQQKEGLDVESCFSESEKLKEEAQKCYDDIEDRNNDMSQFLHMLLLDGCFVVEFIQELHEKIPKGEGKSDIGCSFEHVLRDLALLENLIPFFVIHKLHDMTKHEDDELSFAIMAKCCFLINFRITIPAVAFLDIKHLLHLIHMTWKENPNTDRPTYSLKSFCCNPLQIIMSKEKPKDKVNKVMPNATELSEAGVSFKRFGNIYRSSEKDDIGDTSLFYIKFENGLMKIPCLEVLDNTESDLRNFIAFEQQSDVHPKYFSDYAAFMDYLIDSDSDVKLLRQKGIIVNNLGEDKEVASLFNKILKGVSVSDDFYDKEEYIKLIQHCEKPWNRMKANLIHNYFSSPWVGASTVAAIILLILTTIQTVLAFAGGIK